MKEMQIERERSGKEKGERMVESGKVVMADSGNKVRI